MDRGPAAAGHEVRRMRAMREMMAARLREVALGAGLGLLFLGVGGRVAMRMVAVALGQPPALALGGTLTVVAAGVAAGIAGALLHAISRAAATRLVGAGARRDGDRAHGATWVRVVRLTLFAVLLALVTARGLRGSPGPTWSFWLLVAAYGAALEVGLARLALRGIHSPDHAAPASARTSPA